MDDAESKLEQKVMEFVSEDAGVNLDRISLNTTLYGDLGIDGDDGWDLIASFSKRFNVDCSAYVHSKYFGPEAGCFPPVSIYYWTRHFIMADPHKAGHVRPISIRDLVEAARAKTWMN